MKLLLELKESDIGLLENDLAAPYNLRKAARAVIFNNENKIALLNVSEHNYHKLPGGGLEAGEDIKMALEREALEEAGCCIEIIDEVGIIIEYKNEFKILQISYCYLAKSVGELKQPTFTEDEQAGGFQLLWVNIDGAIALLTKDEPQTYHGKFIQKRDLALLEEAKRIAKIN